MTGGVPLSIAFIAGALATLNPCGFPLLPAYLSFYVGADESRLPRASSRVLQGLLARMLVTAGFLGVFAIVGLPIVYGAGFVADLVPWAGLAVGIALALAGVVALSGRRLDLGIRNPLTPAANRGLGTMVVFGAGYGIASLACTLPLFLALVACRSEPSAKTRCSSSPRTGSAWHSFSPRSRSRRHSPAMASAAASAASCRT